MRIGILACSKTKAATPCAAVELYQGRTFRAAVELLRARGCDRLVILSALHLALAEDDVVSPYERCLSDLDAAGRRAWARAANGKLFNLILPETTGASVLAIVPALYAPALEGLPRVSRLFAGLPQGRLYQALRTELTTLSTAPEAA
jgi:hypothetical protein